MNATPALPGGYVPRQQQPGQEDPTGYIATASAEQLAQVAPDQVLDTIRGHLAAADLFVPYLVASLTSSAALWLAVPFGLLAVVAALLSGLLLLGLIPVYRWNRERCTAWLLYDITSPQIADRIAMCTGAAGWLGRSAGLWHVYYAVATDDAEHNAGASTLIRRSAVHCAPGTLERIRSNIETWCVPAGPQRVLFLPDRLLIVDSTNQLAGIPYDWIDVRYETSRFIEDTCRPPDAEFIEWTWRYVNKSGGPDRRFRDNVQIPIFRYGEVHIESRVVGVRVVLQCSNRQCAEGAVNALQALVHKARETGDTARAEFG